MSERNAEVIRKEIAAERQNLDAELTALKSDVRSLGLVVAAGLVVVAIVTWRKGARKGATTVWKLAR
jgi:hypothetical protein